jgi:hypothetical protein
MQSGVRQILAVALFVCLAFQGSVQSQQNWCPGPCTHRMHPYDVVPCSHVCYGPYGAYACHPMGDAIPCIHPVHPYDLYPC